MSPTTTSRGFEVLLEAIGEASAKVIVVVPFKGIMRALQRELEEHYTVGMLNGDVSARGAQPDHQGVQGAGPTRTCCCATPR
jgi:hypothetical protein